LGRSAGAAPELMVEIASTTPPDDRTADRRVFPGATPNAVKNVIDRACKRRESPTITLTIYDTATRVSRSLGASR
jgi:hypothetical protein